MRGLGFDKPLSGNDTLRTNIQQTNYNAIIKDKGALQDSSPAPAIRQCTLHNPHLQHNANHGLKY